MELLKENWIFAEVDLNKVNPITYQLITKMNQVSNLPVTVVLIEGSNESLEDDIKEYGPDKIITIKNDQLAQGNDLEMTNALDTLIDKTGRPNSFVFAATVVGRSLAPRLQARLRTGLTADCLDLHFEDDDTLVQTKPSYGDNIMCEIVVPNHRPQMATVRSNVFEAKKFNNPSTKVINITNLKVVKDNQLTILSKPLPQESAESITEASRIVAIGRGDKTEENLTNAKRLADKLHAVIGVTRPLTDLDEFDINDQIGQSGQSVSPDILINLGISGAVQYTAGISNAKTIVSANTDKDAPIFKYSDYYYVGNAEEFSKALERALQ